MPFSKKEELRIFLQFKVLGLLESFNKIEQTFEYLFEIELLINKNEEQIRLIRNKTLEDFIILRKICQKINTSTDLNSNDNFPLLNEENIVLNKKLILESYLNSLNNYLQTISKNTDNLKNLLYFFEIPEKYHEKIHTSESTYKKLKKLKKKKFQSVISKPSARAKLTKSHFDIQRLSYSVSSDGLAEIILENENGGKFDEEGIIIFFHVEIIEHLKTGDHYIFTIVISIADEPEIKWKIFKRFNDFIKFEEDMKKILKKNIILPKLPDKFIIFQSNYLKKRQLDLENYLKRVLNEKIYFNEILFKFINLDESYYDLFLLKPIQITFSNYVAKINQCYFRLDKNSEPYEIYSIQLIINLEYSYSIFKRFSDFYQLHKELILREFFKEKNVKLPSRISSFILKTGSKRKIDLEDYLNQLFQIEGIEDSYVFREFLKNQKKFDKDFGNNMEDFNTLKENFLSLQIEY